MLKTVNLKLKLKPCARRCSDSAVLMQHCHVATMVSEVVKVGYLMQGGILIVHNFVNTHERWLSCIYLLSVHHSESTNMFIGVIFCSTITKV